jgi:hypothetical protein
MAHCFILTQILEVISRFDNAIQLFTTPRSRSLMHHGTEFAMFMLQHCPYPVPFLNASTIPKQKFSTLSYQEFNLLEHFGGGIRNTLLSFPVSACISACP